MEQDNDTPPNIMKFKIPVLDVSAAQLNSDMGELDASGTYSCDNFYEHRKCRTWAFGTT